jgi:hypothetical protein
MMDDDGDGRRDRRVTGYDKKRRDMDDPGLGLDYRTLKHTVASSTSTWYSSR